MAFAGVAVVTPVTDTLVRITGVSLAGSQSGTIGLDGDVGADVQLPAFFRPEVYRYDGAVVDLDDSVQCWYVHTDPGGGGESRHIHVDKTLAPFRITITNDQGVATSNIEIYVRFK